jgi:hypothetical protein
LLGKKHTKVLVLPDRLANALDRAIKELGLITLIYSRNGNKIKFDDESMLKLFR